MSGHLTISITSTGFVANDAPLIPVPTNDAENFLTTISSALEGIDFSNITNIRVEGSDDGVVFLDHDGVPIRPIVWADDDSSAPDASWCTKKHDEAWWINRVGVAPTHRAMVTKLSWLHRSEPESWSRIARICTPAQFVRWRLGRDTKGPIVASATELSLTALWQVSTRSYCNEVLTLIDSERDWNGVLPVERPIGSTVGSLYGVLVIL
ncbi:MAG: FGGY family carbohydrate kinase [Actinomycetota bacterium]